MGVVQCGCLVHWPQSCHGSHCWALIPSMLPLLLLPVQCVFAVFGHPDRLYLVQATLCSTTQITVSVTVTWFRSCPNTP